MAKKTTMTKKNSNSKKPVATKKTTPAKKGTIKGAGKNLKTAIKTPPAKGATLKQAVMADKVAGATKDEKKRFLAAAGQLEKDGILTPKQLANLQTGDDLDQLLESDAPAKKSRALTKLANQAKTGDVIPLQPAVGNKYIKSELCLSCYNCAEHHEDTSSGEVVINCSIELRHDAQELLYGTCPNYRQHGKAQAEQQMYEEAAEPDPDHEKIEEQILEPYMFVGDSLTRVDNPKPGQVTMMLTERFVEMYNMWVVNVKAALTKTIDQAKAAADKKMQAAKSNLLADPENALEAGVDFVTGDIDATEVDDPGDEDDEDLSGDIDDYVDDDLDEDEDDEDDFDDEEDEEDEDD